MSQRGHVLNRQRVDWCTCTFDRKASRRRPVAHAESQPWHCKLDNPQVYTQLTVVVARRGSRGRAHAGKATQTAKATRETAHAAQLQDIGRMHGVRELWFHRQAKPPKGVAARDRGSSTRNIQQSQRLYLLHHVLQVHQAVRPHLVQDAWEQLLDLCARRNHVTRTLDPRPQLNTGAAVQESPMAIYLLFCCDGPLIT